MSGRDRRSARCTQLRHLAKIRAIDVLPTPRVPQKRYAWAIRFKPDGVLERLDDVFLADDVVEPLRAIAASDDGVGRRGTAPDRRCGRRWSCGRGGASSGTGTGAGTGCRLPAADGSGSVASALGLDRFFDSRRTATLACSVMPRLGEEVIQVASTNSTQGSGRAGEVLPGT